MIRRRTTEVFTLSFLDALSCGFGAILLIFLLSIGSGNAGVQSPVDENTLADLRRQLAQLEADVANKASRLETATENEDERRERQNTLSRIQELESTLADLQQELDARQANLNASEKAAAQAERLLRNFPYENLPPIGLPSEATHIAFVIDTSGSMRNQLTRKLHFGVVEQINRLLDNLPEAKKIQLLDTSGNYILGNRAGIWLPDTPGLRQQALRRLLDHQVLSVSDPGPGIRTALRDLRPALGQNDRMSLYMLGDDFRGSTQSFLLRLDRLNPRDPQTGNRSVSISAVGFPTLKNPFRLGAPQGNTRFANIMREVAHAHDGVLILQPEI